MRAVDEESAAGAVRARGHNVIGVTVATMPKRGTASPRISCLNCGYLLKKLPAGDAGEVLCPECGVINTPLGGEDSLWSEIKATGAEFGRQQKVRPFSTRPLALLLFVAAFVAVVMLVVIPFLRWTGLIP